MIETQPLSDQQIREIIEQLEKVLKNREHETELREKIRRAKESILDAEVQLSKASGENVIPDPIAAPAEPLIPDAQPWCQRSGKEPGWARGAVVLYRGGYWENLEEGNRYSPAAYPQGWKLLGPLT